MFVIQGSTLFTSSANDRNAFDIHARHCEISKQESIRLCELLQTVRRCDDAHCKTLS